MSDIHVNSSLGLGKSRLLLSRFYLHAHVLYKAQNSSEVLFHSVPLIINTSVDNYTLRKGTMYLYVIAARNNTFVA